MQLNSKPKKIIYLSIIASPFVAMLLMYPLASYQKNNNLSRANDLIRAATPPGHELGTVSELGCNSIPKIGPAATNCGFRFDYNSIDSSLSFDDAKQWFDDRGWVAWISPAKRAAAALPGELPGASEQYYYKLERNGILQQTFNCDIWLTTKSDEPESFSVSGSCSWKHNTPSVLFS